MDDEAVALLTTAGTTVVGLMVTDAWNQTHDELVRLWHRFRPEHADAVGRELATSQATVVAAQAGGGVPADAALGTLLARELKELLADPRAARELGELLRACTLAASASSESDTTPRKIRVEAKATGRARAYAAGRDMTIIERPGDDRR